jgi:putative ABC transport system permease protein
MRVPLKRGRFFADADRVGAPNVVLVNAAAAREFWPNEDAIGKHVRVGFSRFPAGAEVVGVVGDVRALADSAPKPAVYLSYFQSPQEYVIAFLRTSGDPGAVANAARRAVREIAPGYPVYDVQSMGASVASATAQARFSAALLALFAATALALAIIGIYGVMSFTVAQRTREIGIRMALGADRRAVLWMVIAEGVALAGAGTALGLAGALGFTRVLRSLLFDMQPSDPATYVSIVALLALAALVATWIPARRATRVDPTEALRVE